MTNSIQVIDNFLPNEVFEAFAYTCMTEAIYAPSDSTAGVEECDGSINKFGEDLTPVDQKNFAEVMFQALLFRRNPSYNIVHDVFSCYPLFYKKLEELLNVKRWWILRLNATMGQSEPHQGRYHVDFDGEHGELFADTTTAILYLNTNTGGTKFRDTGEFVQSKRNRLVTFPTHTYHAGVWSTDAKLRFVLNMTFETK